MATYVDADGNIKELPEGEYILSDVTAKMSAWVPTSALRFVKTSDGIKLQQRWADWLSSDTEWPIPSGDLCPLRKGTPPMTRVDTFAIWAPIALIASTLAAHILGWL